MPDARPSGTDEVRTADVIGVLCLATDLAMGLPLEHGLHSTVVASRLAERVGVDRETAVETYYGCLLFYSGCTADADVTVRLFPDGALLDSFTPVMFGSSRETALGITRALGSPSAPRPLRVLHGATRLPAATPGTSWRCARSPRCSARGSGSRRPCRTSFPCSPSGGTGGVPEDCAGRSCLWRSASSSFS